ncbi:MAG TPA: DNA polymerase I [Armatimonadota bacterium]|jgi:DNA polymerase-1
MATSSSGGEGAAKRPVFVVVDGYSLLYRAFFATPNLRTSDGRPTNALYGFANMVLRLLDEYRPQAAAIAWDAPAATFRHEAFTDYKAHRPESPDDFKAQVGPVLDMIKALQLPLIEARGFEADDVLGTLACRAAAEGYDVFIVTGDTDALQLVTDQVKVITPLKGVSDTVTYDPTKVTERYGIRPDQIVDYKALKGDTSDNIPGVAGIGEKTASKLIAEFETLDNLYANLEAVKPDRIRRLLEEGRTNAVMSRDLSEIHCDIALDVDPAGCVVVEPDPAMAKEFFSTWQMRSLETRFANRIAAAEKAAEPDLEERDTDYGVAQSPADVAEFAKSVTPGCLSVALDTDPFADRRDAIRGVALSACAEKGLYVPIGGDSGGLFGTEGLPVSALEPVWAAAGRRIAGHHLKAILKALENAGARGLSAEFDTAVAAYLLDSTRSEYRLADLAGQFLGRRARYVFVKLDRKTVESDEARRNRLMEEADLCLCLHEPMKAELQRAGLTRVHDEVDLPLIPVLAEMERTGISVDVEALRNLSARFDAAIHEAEESVFTLAGETFNIGSTKQLQTILFEKMGLKASKKTKTGYSTDSAVLEALAVEMASSGLESNIVQGILDYRELTKLKATYTDALLNLRDPSTGRVHTTLNQTVAATGRLSSSEPNLQNIPIRTAIGQEIRACFVPAPGLVLLSADYSQIELRVLADITQDPELLRAFREDEDIHRLTASRIFGVPEDEVTPSQRRDAKTVNFAVLYGQSDFGLSAQLKIPRKEAKEYIDAYFARFPSVQDYIEATLKEGRRTGYVTTPIGRRRPVPELNDRNHQVRAAGERAAVNSPIQGASADIIKLAMIELRRELRERGDPAALLLQVHDELVLEMLPENLEPVAALVRTVMENAYPMSVRLKVEAKAGPNWRDMKLVS